MTDDPKNDDRLNQLNAKWRRDTSDLLGMVMAQNTMIALLLEKLIVEQAQIDKNPPKISPEAMEHGRQAMANAIASARRTMEALDAAIATVPSAAHEASEPPPDDPRRWN